MQHLWFYNLNLSWSNSQDIFCDIPQFQIDQERWSPPQLPSEYTLCTPNLYFWSSWVCQNRSHVTDLLKHKKCWIDNMHKTERRALNPEWKIPFWGPACKGPENFFARTKTARFHRKLFQRKLKSIVSRETDCSCWLLLPLSSLSPVKDTTQIELRHQQGRTQIPEIPLVGN